MTWLARLKEKIAEVPEVAKVAKETLATLAPKPASHFKKSKPCTECFLIDISFNTIRSSGDISGQNFFHHIPILELRKAAGDNWLVIMSNPDSLKSFAHAVVNRRMRQLGKRPVYYTQKSICWHCGPVWLWSGAPEHMDICPWCFNRMKGISIPQPE